jgi:cobalt/nickel transport system ATP-binding protein
MSQTHASSSPRRADTTSSALIELEDLCVAYGEIPALRHVDLRITAGTCVVLMGDNGSGKSTLLRVLCGLLHPQQGSYRFDGDEVSERSLRMPGFAKRLHQRVGFIFQDSDAQLFCASVEDEIAFGPRQMGLSDDEVARRVADTLALLDIEHLRTRAPYSLSGGEK